MSRARLFRSIKALDLEAVAPLLAAEPALARATDDRRRNPLHFLCSLPGGAKTAARSIALARRLLGAPEPDWTAVRHAHDRDDGFRVPALVTSFGSSGPTRVAVDVEPEPARPATT